MGDDRVGPPRRATRARRLIALLVVLSVAAEGLATTPPPAAADSILDGQLVPCGTDLCATGVVQPSLYVQKAYDRIVQFDPTKPANNAWMSLEDEARTAIAALHDSPNDRRLVYWARDEIRGYMYMRLVDVVTKKRDGKTLTAKEQSWYDLLQSDVKEVRKRRAQVALDEYARWENNPCVFQPPPGFGFAQLQKDASCAGGTGVTFSTPPTADQFQAYAAAKVGAEQKLDTADAAVAAQKMQNIFLLLGGMAAAGVLSVALASLILAVPIVGSGIAAAIGTAAGAAAFGAWAGTSLTANAVASAAASVGIGAAAGAGVIFIIVIAAIVTAIAFYQILQGAQVKPTLQDAFDKANSASFDLTALLGTEQGGTDMFGVFLARTLPDRTAEIIANEPGPPAHTIADPDFLVDGSTTPTTYLQTRTWNDEPQLAYLSGSWWAVSVNGGPFRWSPTLYYLTLGADGSRAKSAVMVDGDGFIVSSPAAQGLDDPFAYQTPSFEYLWSLGPGTSTAVLHGNHRPELAPSIPATIDQGATVTFEANATDVDAGDALDVRWIIEPEPAFVTLVTSSDPSNVDCTDPDIVPTRCSWPTFTGQDVTLTRRTPGTYLARVIATDSKGAVRVSTFSFTVRNEVPVFTIGPVITMNGRTATLTGRFSDPGNEAVSATIDWGDGTSTVVSYPCDVSQAGVGCVLGPAADPTDVSVQHTYGLSSLGKLISPAVRLSDGIGSSLSPVLTFRLPLLPVASPSSSPATPVEGDTITFTANGVTSEPGATITSVTWSIEPEPVPGVLVSPAMDALCRGPGTATGCNWPTFTGNQVQVTYRREGTYLARAIVTDSLGQVDVVTTSVTVANAPTAFTEGPTVRFAGQTATVAGQFADQGNDQVVMTVDWGDGTSSTRRFPCDTTQICVGSPPASRPSAFSFTHTYTGAIPAATTFPKVSLHDGTATTGPVVATRLVAPKPPTITSALPSGDGRVTVRFTPPTDTGGLPITSYRAVCSSSDGGTARSASGLLTSFVVSGLTAGATYVCRMAAQNDLGWGSASAPSATVVVLGKPTAPTGVVATQGGSAQLSVAFTPGVGSPATSYRAVCTSATGATRSAVNFASPVVVSSLTGGSTYTCSVTATNVAGTGPASAPSAPVRVVSVPGAPFVWDLGYTSRTTAVVAVTAPLTDGGLPVVSYRAVCTSTDGGVGRSWTKKPTGTITEITITGLSATASYTCRASATNAVGTSTASRASTLAQDYLPN